MSTEVSTAHAERQAYMKGPGFVLFNDVTEQLLGRLAEQPLPPAEDYFDVFRLSKIPGQGIEGLYDPMVSLYAVSFLLTEQVPNRTNTRLHDRLSLFPMTHEERLEVEKHTHNFGTDDLDLPWVLSPAIAAATVHAFVRSGKLPETVAQNLSLDDWADMISSGWFGELMNVMALTGFGVYQKFGRYVTDYQPGAFEHALKEPLKKYGEPSVSDDIGAFETQVVEAGVGLADLKAVLSPPYAAALKSMRGKSLHSVADFQGKSIGCTVAREAAMLPPDHPEIMPRAGKLQEMGRLTIADKPGPNGMVLATQEESAIDRTLIFIAGQLRAYEGYLAAYEKEAAL
jgi:hypothetical protein